MRTYKCVFLCRACSHPYAVIVIHDSNHSRRGIMKLASLRKKKETGKILIFRSEDYIPNKSLTLDLISPVYTRQFCSLVEGCECFTCVRHTRGYINHLLITHELLAPTLLMLHNLFHVRTLLNLLKTKVEGGVLTDYEAALKKVFTPANWNLGSVMRF